MKVHNFFHIIIKIDIEKQQGSKGEAFPFDDITNQLREILTFITKRKFSKRLFKMILVHKGMITMGALRPQMPKVASSG